MENQIKKILRSMDVKQDREDAQAKAFEIFKLGPEALEILVKIGNFINRNEADQVRKKKWLRAVILAIAMFARKRIFLKPYIFSSSNAISLLCELSSDGYQSATLVLHNIGFSDADILKERLMSLPIVDSLPSDREISVDEALQEIKITQLIIRINDVRKDVFVMGQSRKHTHEIVRIGKTAFACRVKRRH